MGDIEKSERPAQQRLEKIECLVDLVAELLPVAGSVDLLPAERFEAVQKIMTLLYQIEYCWTGDNFCLIKALAEPSPPDWAVMEMAKVARSYLAGNGSRSLDSIMCLGAEGKGKNNKAKNAYVKSCQAIAATEIHFLVSALNFSAKLACELLAQTGVKNTVGDVKVYQSTTLGKLYQRAKNSEPFLSSRSRSILPPSATPVNILKRFIIYDVAWSNIIEVYNATHRRKPYDEMSNEDKKFVKDVDKVKKRLAELIAETSENIGET